MKEVEVRMRRKGALKVNAAVYEDSAPSLNLFKKLGFVADRRSVLHGRVLTGDP